MGDQELNCAACTQIMAASMHRTANIVQSLHVRSLLSCPVHSLAVAAAVAAAVVQIGLVLLDEVHLLNESGRGSSLEAGCVCRIKAVAAFPEMAKAPIASVRFVAVSATIPNIADVSALQPTGVCTPAQPPCSCCFCP